MAPLTPLVEKLDALGQPGAGQRAIAAPKAIAMPATFASPTATPLLDGLITVTPTAPIPGTVSPAPPSDQ